MSGAKWLLDTNVVIGLLKKQPAAIALAEAQHLNLNQNAYSLQGRHVFFSLLLVPSIHMAY